MADLIPGQADVSMGAQPNERAFTNYETAGLAAGPLANLSLIRQTLAQEDPSEIRRLRDQAKQYLNQGVGALSEIGTANGLTGAEWGNVANLFGGNPLEGALGWSTPKNQVQQAALGEGQAAQLANEYQKQKAQAMLQFGVPEAINMTAQDMANFNQAGIVNAMANPQIAAMVKTQGIENQLAPLNTALRAREVAYHTGEPLTTENVNVRTPGGQQIGASVGGIGLSKYVNPSSMTQAQREMAGTQEENQLQRYTALAAQNNPEIIQARTEAVDNVINNLNNQTSVLPGGVYTASPKDAEALKSVGITSPDQITQGKIQELQKMFGQPTPVTTVLSALQQVQDIPGYEDVTKNVLNALNSNSQVNVKALTAQLEGAGAKFEQQASIAPVVTDNINRIRQQGGSGRADVGRLQTDAIQKGYSEQLTPATRELAQIAVQGLKVPDTLTQRMNGGVGYAGDAIRSALASGPEARKQMVENLTDFLDQKFTENGIKKNPKVEAIKFINAYTKKDVGGMQ